MATQQHQEENLTLEQIEAHLKKANIEQYTQAPQGDAKALDLAATLRRVCGVYRAIRPILKVIVAFPLLPSSIKNAVRSFMSVMDTICP